MKYKKIKASILEYMDFYLEEGITFLRKKLNEMVTSMDNNLVQSLCRIMSCFFPDYVETEVKKVTDEELDGL